MHSSGVPLHITQNNRQNCNNTASLRNNKIRQKHQIPLASFGWIMLHFLHCRHPFFLHARAQPAAVAASSFRPVPPGPGPNLVPPKLCQNLAYSCPSLQTFPSPHLHRLVLSSTASSRWPSRTPTPGPGLPLSLSKSFQAAQQRLTRDHKCISADPTVVSPCRISVKPSHK